MRNVVLINISMPTVGLSDFRRNTGVALATGMKKLRIFQRKSSKQEHDVPSTSTDLPSDDAHSERHSIDSVPHWDQDDPPLDSCVPENSDKRQQSNSVPTKVESSDTESVQQESASVQTHNSRTPSVTRSNVLQNNPQSSTGSGVTKSRESRNAERAERQTERDALMRRIRGIVTTRGRQRSQTGRVPILVDFAATSFTLELVRPDMFASGYCDIKSWLASIAEPCHDVRWRNAIWVLFEHARMDNINLLSDDKILADFCRAVVRKALSELPSVTEGAINANSWRQAKADNDAFNLLKLAQFMLAWHTWYDTADFSCLRLMEQSLDRIRAAPGIVSDDSGRVVIERLEHKYNIAFLDSFQALQT